jgi:nitrogen-specific signal transduction histidine kinase
MAHEIRNPLSSAGGFARRLRDSLPEHDPRRRLAQIIVEEVTRLENFMKVLLSSMRPIELSLGEVDVNDLLDAWLARLEGHLNSCVITAVKGEDPAERQRVLQEVLEVFETSTKV